jgi:hypothetical protein
MYTWGFFWMYVDLLCVCVCARACVYVFAQKKCVYMWDFFVNGRERVYFA